MKNRIKLVFSLALFSMISLGAFAQNYNTNYSYEYNDDIYLDDYDDRFDNRRGDRNYRDDRAYRNDRNGNRNYRSNNRGSRNNRSYRNARYQRNRKAAILDRAYARAYRDGWLSRRERRELIALESRLGIYRLDRRGRRICR